ncbi:EXS family-domain-containing protein, partial [Peziza echinospora]
MSTTMSYSTLLTEATIEQFDRTTFSIYFPLPFRILSLILLGFWLCALSFHYFHLVKIDIGALVRYTTPPGLPIYRDIYRVSTTLTVVFSAGIIWFWHTTGGRAEEVTNTEWVPMGVAGVFLLLLCWPGNSWHRRGRGRFLRMFRRVIVGGLDRGDLRFADVLLADVVTSYAKVLGDSWVLGCMVLSGGRSITDMRPERGCGGTWGVPFAMAVPSLIRLRQCLTDYLRARRVGGGGEEMRLHLWNAGKYASAFPVIWLSAVQRDWVDGGLLAVFINSSYSFYWDVTKDWDLPLFSHIFTTSPIDLLPPSPLPSPPSSSSTTPWGLRANRHYHATSLYYIVILTDFCLRCTWSFKLSPHLGHVNDLEGGIYLLEVLELVRRWMWMFLRVEREWCRRIEGGVGAEEG